jgi:hypothetical protein
MVSEAGGERGAKSLRHPRHSRGESCKLRDVEDAFPGSRTRHRIAVIAIEPSVIRREMPSRAPQSDSANESGSGAHALRASFHHPGKCAT